MFDGPDFLAELTGTPARAGAERSDQGQHIPPKGVQYIRRYGLYASRTRGKWTEHLEIIKHAPSGWKAAQQESPGNEKTFDEEESEVTDRTSRKAWARLLTKVYEIDPMVCPRMHGRAMSEANDQSEMRIRDEGYCCYPESS